MGSSECPPLLRSNVAFVRECSYLGCAPPILPLSRSFMASPSPSWSFSGSACKELGCIHLSDHALPLQMDFSSCLLVSFSIIFILLSLSTIHCLFWVWDSCIKWGLATGSYFTFNPVFGFRQITYLSVLGVLVCQVKLMVTDTKSTELLRYAPWWCMGRMRAGVPERTCLLRSPCADIPASNPSVKTRVWDMEMFYI